MLLVYVGLLGLTYYGFTNVPGGFIPNQDKGYLIVNVQLPDSASLERTVAVMDRIQKIVAETPGVAHTVDIPGQSFVMNGVSSNFGTLFITSSRSTSAARPTCTPRRSPTSCAAATTQEIEQAQVLVFGAPAVDGLGNAGGFKLMLEGTGSVDLQAAGGADGQPRARRAARSPASSACSAASAPPRRSSTWTWTASSARR